MKTDERKRRIYIYRATISTVIVYIAGNEKMKKKICVGIASIDVRTSN